MKFLRSTNYNPSVFLESFFILFAFMRLFSLNTIDFISFPLFLLIYFVLHQNMHHLKEGLHIQRDIRVACIGSLLFTLFTIAARYDTLLGDLSSRLFCLIILLLSTIGFFLFYYFMIRFLMYLSESITVTTDTFSSRRLPLLTFFACMLGWLPYLLYNYPGVMTPDSINQYAQIIGVYAQSNHHPWMHTLLIHVFYSLGLALTHNKIIAISFYTIFQMCFLAFTASYTIYTLQTVRVKNSICYLSILFYAVMPYNGALAVTIWKDVMFAAAFTLFTCTLIHFLALEKRATKSANIVVLCIIYGISGFMVCLFRTNGWYVFLFTLPFLLYTLRAHIRILLPINLVLILLVLLIKIPIMNIYQVIQPDFAESLSIPAQQIARVYALDRTVREEQNEQLALVVDTTRLKEAYQPDVYDNVKYLIREGNQEYLVSHKLDYLKLWIAIGLEHPKDYLDAFVAQTCGYWYPDVACEIGLNEGIYENDFSLVWTPVLKGNLFIKLKEITFKLYSMIPLFGLFWSMGSIFWMILLLISFTFKRNSTQSLIVFLPALVLVGTLCLATPVAAEFRYVYSIFYTLPVYLVTPFLLRHN